MAIVVEIENVKAGEDRFAVKVGGETLTTHPRQRGAETLARRYNETGNLW